MSDEEKKTINLLKHCQNTHIENTKVEKLLLTTKEAKIILNLIEKQQKEIEELKKYEKYYEEMEEVNKKFISKDKIKAKIDLIDKEYAEHIEKNKNDLYLVNINAQRHDAMKVVLEELLEEKE